VQVAVRLPSVVVTVIVAVPAPTALTLPLASTVATLALLDVQVTARLPAFDGLTVGVSTPVSPARKFIVVLFNVTPVTGTETVTVQVAVTFDKSHLAVIVAVPAPTADTTPSGLTLATRSFDDVQVTPRPLAFAGVYVTDNVAVPPPDNVRSVLLRVILVAPPPGAMTVTLVEAPSLVPVTERLMFVVPVLTPVTTPLLFTVAPAGFDDDQTNVLLSKSFVSKNGKSDSV